MLNSHRRDRLGRRVYVLVGALVAIAALSAIGALVARAVTTDIAPAAHAIPLGFAPERVAADPVGRRVYVIGRTQDTYGGVATQDTHLAVLDARSGAVLRRATVAPDFRPLMALAPRAGRLFLASDGGGAIAMCDTRSGRLVRALQDPFGRIAGMTVDNRDGRLVVLHDSAIAFFDMRDGRFLRSVEFERLTAGERPLLSGAAPLPLPLVAVAVDERSDRLFVRRLDGSVLMLDARTGTLLHLLDRVWSGDQWDHDQFTPLVVDGRAFADESTLAIAPRAGRVFVAAYPGILILDARNGRRRGTVSAPPSALAVDETTARLVAAPYAPYGDPGGMRPGVATVLDLSNDRILRRTRLPASNYLRLVIDVRRQRVYLDASIRDTSIALDAKTGRRLPPLPAHSGTPAFADPVSGALFSWNAGGMTILPGPSRATS